MKTGDHIKVKDNHYTREKNLHGRYGHITEMGGEWAVVQFNDHSEKVHIDDLEPVPRS